MREQAGKRARRWVVEPAHSWLTRFRRLLVRWDKKSEKRFPPGSTRVAELDEALHVIKAMWTQERATFEERYYSIKGARCEPKPDRLTTITVGAFRPQMLRLVARHADWWNASSTDIADYGRYVEEFQRACDEVGRDPATVRRVWGGGCVCAPTEDGEEAVSALLPRRK